MAQRAPSETEIEAAHWLVVLDSPSPSKADIETFQAWLAADDAHKHAYEAVSATSDKIDALLSADAGRLELDEQSAPPPLITGRRAVWAGGALAAACAASLLLLPPLGLQGSRQLYETAPGQPRLVALNEGSTIELAPGARIRVVLSETARSVRLDEGVALFNVARDAERPFIVSTRYGDILVTGTSFVVRLGENGVVTTVLSGRVEARRRTLWPNDTPPAAVGQANTEIRLARDGLSVSPLQTEVMERRLIWRDRMVALDGQSLREAAAEIARFSGVRFEFADTATGDIRLSGYVEGDDVDGFLALLESNVGVDAERRGDGVVLLRRSANR